MDWIIGVALTVGALAGGVAFFIFIVLMLRLGLRVGDAVETRTGSPLFGLVVGASVGMGWYAFPFLGGAVYFFATEIAPLLR